MTALAALGLAVAIGWLLVRILQAGEALSPRWARCLAQLALGAGVGIAISAALFLVLRLTGMASRGVVLGAELALLAALAVAASLLRRGLKPLSIATASRGFKWNWLLGIAVVLALVLIAVTLANTASVSPYGNWEAFAAWNLNAKFLLAPGASGSSIAVPSLLSAFVARTWLLSGGTSPLTALAISIAFAASAVVMLFAFLVVVRGVGSALLAVLIFLSAGSFVEQIPWQYADIPVGFYLLAAIGSALLGQGDPKAYGLSAAFSAFALWMLVPLLLLPVGPAAGTIKVSAGIVAAEAVSWGAGLSHPAVLIVILSLVLRFDFRPEHRRFLIVAGVAVVLILAVEAALYLTSPGELPWLLGTRVKGMYAQVWPAVVLLVFLVLRKVEDPERVEQPKLKKGKR